MTTAFLEHFAVARRAFEVLEGGTQTTIQDYPGRLGYWHVGVPPSGPMDTLAFRLANRLVGNAPDAAALEMTTMGARLRFDSDAWLRLPAQIWRRRLTELAPAVAELSRYRWQHAALWRVRGGGHARLSGYRRRH